MPVGARPARRTFREIFRAVLVLCFETARFAAPFKFYKPACIASGAWFSASPAVLLPGRTPDKPARAAPQNTRLKRALKSAPVWHSVANKVPAVAVEIRRFSHTLIVLPSVWGGSFVSVVWGMSALTSAIAAHDIPARSSATSAVAGSAFGPIAAVVSRSIGLLRRTPIPVFDARPAWTAPLLRFYAFARFTHELSDKGRRTPARPIGRVGQIGLRSAARLPFVGLLRAIIIEPI